MILNFKKISSLALLFGSSITIAGTMGPIESSKTYSGFYIEGVAGWTASRWTDSLNYIFQSQTSVF